MLCLAIINFSLFVNVLTFGGGAGAQGSQNWPNPPLLWALPQPCAAAINVSLLSFVPAIRRVQPGTRYVTWRSYYKYNSASKQCCNKSPNSLVPLSAQPSNRRRRLKKRQHRYFCFSTAWRKLFVMSSPFIREQKHNTNELVQYRTLPSRNRARWPNIAVPASWLATTKIHPLANLAWQQ